MTATGVLVALLVLVSTALAAMVREEVATRLAMLPRAVIRVAGLWLPRSIRADRVDEWLDEHTYIVGSTAGLPLTRLARGLRYAIGICRGVPAVSRAVGGAAVPAVVLRLKARVSRALFDVGLLGVAAAFTPMLPLFLVAVVACELGELAGRLRLGVTFVEPTRYDIDYDDALGPVLWLCAPGACIWGVALALDWFHMRRFALPGLAVLAAWALFGAVSEYRRHCATARAAERWIR